VLRFAARRQRPHSVESRCGAAVLAEMDYVGRILDAVSRLKLADNTIFIFSSDNGPEDTMPWRGWACPWSGTYVTGIEGSLRVPFIIRWPGKVPAGRVSNEMYVAWKSVLMVRIHRAPIATPALPRNPTPRAAE